MKTIRLDPDMQPMPPLDAYKAEAPEQVRTSTFFSAADLAGQEVPARHWLVDGLIPSGTVTLLSGDGGTGKSLLSLQLACAVANGGAWVGRQTAGGRAHYISAEDDKDELHRRLADIARQGAFSLADIDRLTIRSLAGEDALLAVAEGRSAVLRASSLFDEIERQIVEDEPALVVLDTLADLFPGNENDRAQARQFVGMLRGLAIRHECAVLLLAHPSLSGLNSGSGTSGSTGWNNSVRSRLYLERISDEGYEADPDARIIRTMKSNYGRTGGEIALRWLDGVFVAPQQETGLDRMAGNAKAERVFLKLLREFSGEGRTVSAKTGHGYGPAIFAKSGRAEGCSKAALTSAMETLFSKKAVILEEFGPPSRRANRIVEAS